MMETKNLLFPIRNVVGGSGLDNMVQKYLIEVREGGGVVTARVAIAASRAIIITQDKSKLVEFGGHICLNETCLLIIFFF